MDTKKFIYKNLGAKGQLLEQLDDISNIKIFKPKTKIVTQGSNIDSINILISGLLVGYMYDSNGDMIVDCFCFKEGDIAVPPHDFTYPSQITIEAVEESKILQIPLSIVQTLLNDYIEAREIYDVKLMESLKIHNSVKNSMQYHLGKKTAGIDRLRWFVQTFPGLLDRVPRYYICTYIGISYVHLSRLIKQLKEESAVE